MKNALLAALSLASLACSGAGPAPATAAPAQPDAAADPGAPSAAPAAAPAGPSSGKRVPRIRIGQVTLTGPLPIEVVQRIVRQNFGRLRVCYDNGLRANAELEGKVTVKFTIKPDGSVGTVDDGGGTTLPDKDMIACLRRAFGTLSYPEPENGGAVVVLYPMVFSPAADAAPAPAGKP